MKAVKDTIEKIVCALVVAAILGAYGWMWQQHRDHAMRDAKLKELEGDGIPREWFKRIVFENRDRIERLEDAR